MSTQIDLYAIKLAKDLAKEKNIHENDLTDEDIKKCLKRAQNGSIEEKLKRVKESIKEPVKESIKEPVKESVKEPIRKPRVCNGIMCGKLIEYGSICYDCNDL
jgi:phosphomannomutase